MKINTATIADHDLDLLDRRDVINYPVPATKRDYAFDIANQLTSVENVLLPSTTISRYDYPLYDNVGNRKQLTTTGAPGTQAMNYTYNDIYELTGVTGSQAHSYQYDNVANRTAADGVSYIPNTLNQYTSIGPQTYLYDNNGNLTNDGVNTYTYDEENRLSSATNATNATTYQYDGFNRRVSKTVNGVTTYFINDGDREIEERDATGALTADYVYGDDIDEVLTMSRNGNTSYYHYDGLGSVTEITNSSGAVVENYTYDVYGSPSVTSSIGNPFYFTGRRLDSESGLYYYRRRYYDPVIGRFLSRDPLDSGLGISFSPNTFQKPASYLKPINEVNPYLYTGNNPINRIDPLGLWYIDINVSIVTPWFVGGTGGIIFSSTGVYSYAGGSGGTPGPGAAVTWSPYNPSTGWNYGAQGGFWAGGQAGVDSKGAPFWEAGFVTPGGSASAYYVEPFKWPWEKDKKKPCSEGKNE